MNCTCCPTTDGDLAQSEGVTGSLNPVRDLMASRWWKDALDVLESQMDRPSESNWSRRVLNTKLLIHIKSAVSVNHLKIKANKLNCVTKKGSTTFVT